jgi:hypothetical protein
MKKSSILRADDFKEGMFFTVYDIKQKEQSDDFLDGPMSMPMSMMRGEGLFSSPQNELERLKGIVARIEAINLPFLVVTIFESHNNATGKKPQSMTISIDTRDLELIKLNEKYVSAYIGQSVTETLLQNISFDQMQDIDDKNMVVEMLEDLTKKLQNYNYPEKGKNNED